MVRHEDVAVGVVVLFTPPVGETRVGAVTAIADGFVWFMGDRWPLDVFRLNANLIEQEET